MKFKNLMISAAVCGLFATAAVGATVPEVKYLKTQPQSMLVVGNSYMYYNCGINGYLSGLLKASGLTKVKTRIAAIGRGNQSQYPLEEYLDNSLSVSHSKYPAISQDLLDKEIKKRENYELVLMQGSNRGKADQERDAHYVKIHAQAIRDQGGEPAMILTWTQKRKNAPQFSEVQDAVTAIANANHMMVVPVGQAFNFVEKRHPELSLIMPDQTHPTAIGSYLMAATIYASVYARHPKDGLAFEGGCEKPIPEQTRTILADAAWQVVNQWFERK